MVEAYVAGLDPADEPVGVERTVATRTDAIAVSGRIDRLDARPRADGGEGTELVVVDYKTGRHPLTVDDARSSLALALYALAASRALRRECRRVELHHLPSRQVLAWEHTAETLQRHLRRAENIAEACADADERMRAPLPVDSYDEVFPPRTGPACGWCDYLRNCPEGQLAATAHRPWDGLAEI
jgi:RecB family exonuclease